MKPATWINFWLILTVLISCFHSSIFPAASRHGIKDSLNPFPVPLREGAARFVTTHAADKVVSGVDRLAFRTGVPFADIFKPPIVSYNADTFTILEQLCPVRQLGLELPEHLARVLIAKGTELYAFFIRAFFDLAGLAVEALDI